MKTIETESFLRALKVADEINSVSRGEGPSRMVFLFQGESGIKVNYFHSYATARVWVSDDGGPDQVIALPLDVLLDVISVKGVDETVKIKVDEKNVTVFSKVESRRRRNKVHVLQSAVPLAAQIQRPETVVRGAVDEIAHMLSNAAKAMHARKDVPKTSMVGPLIRLTVGDGYAEVAATDSIRFYHKNVHAGEQIDGDPVSITLSARYAKSVAKLIGIIDPDEVRIGQFGVWMESGDDFVNIPVSTHRTPDISEILRVLRTERVFSVDNPKSLLDALVDLERNLGRHVTIYPENEDEIRLSSKSEKSDIDLRVPVSDLIDFDEVRLGTSSVITGLECFKESTDVFIPSEGQLRLIAFDDGQQSYFCAGMARKSPKNG